MNYIPLNSLGKKPVIQPGLTINTPGDQYEQEADAMADRVMRMSSNEAVKPVTGLIGKSLQRKCAHCEEEEKRKKPVMRKTEAGHSGMPVSSSFAASLNASKGSGSPLPQGTRSFMETAFSADFSGVKIHTGTQAANMSKGINAKAFTYGNDIYFGEAQYNPGSMAGRHLLGHELTHVVQQSGPERGNLLQRNCRNHPDESLYSSASNYCRDTGFTGMFHTGRTCYREVPVRTSYWECPPGDQVCFNENGTCEDSYDEASPVESRDSDGSCNLHHACTWTYHTTDDVAPGLLEQATAPLAEGMGWLESEIYKLYGVPYF